MNDGNKGYYWGVDLFKLICAVLVVSIHTTLFYEYDALYYYFHEYLTRFAVPFFFVSGGFFFARNLLKETEIPTIRKNILKYAKRLLRPFIIWGGYTSF